MDVFSYLYIVSFFNLRPSHTFCFSLLLFVKPLLMPVVQSFTCWTHFVDPSPQMLLQLHGWGLILVLVASGEGNRVLPSKGKVTSCLPLLCQHIGLPSVEQWVVFDPGCLNPAPFTKVLLWTFNCWRGVWTWLTSEVCGKKSSDISKDVGVLSPALLTSVPFHWQEGFRWINSVLPWCSSLKKQLLEFWSHVMWMNSANSVF